MSILRATLAALLVLSSSRAGAQELEPELPMGAPAPTPEAAPASAEEPAAPPNLGAATSAPTPSEPRNVDSGAEAIGREESAATPRSGDVEAERDTYELEVELLPDSRQVRGRVAIRWRNRGSVPARDLAFHLYPNAFASRETVFMRESGGQLRGDRFAGTGGLEVTSVLRVIDGETVSLDERDDQLIEGDHTQLRVSLGDAPLEVGEWITLRLEFTTTLPPLFARSGYAGDFYLVAQFFPKLAAYAPEPIAEPNAVEVGAPASAWVSFPYHGFGEFYADFADYSAAITRPSEYVLAAPGEQVEERSAGGKTTTRVRAPRRHDFVFAAAPALQTRHRTLAGDEGPIELTTFFPPGYEDAAARVEEVTALALADYSRLYGPYGWETLVVVIPPRGAEGGAGMEYPGFFTAAGPWRANSALPILHDEVSAHELGHQWFQSMLASNEVAAPFLDEGLTDWITGDFMQRLHGRDGSVVNLGPVRLGAFEMRRAMVELAPRHTPIARPAHEFTTSADYGAGVYAGTASLLETIARTWGRARVHRALGSYARAHRFTHVTRADLEQAFAEEFGPWMVARVLQPALDLPPADAHAHARLVGNDVHAEVVVERTGRVQVPLRVRLWRGEEHEDRWLRGSETELALPADPERTRIELDPTHQNLLCGDRRDDILSEPRVDPARESLLVSLWAWTSTLFGVFGP